MEAATVFFSPVTVTIFIGITTFFLLVWHSSRNHSYWKKRNVPFVKPYPLIGSFLANAFAPNHEVEQERYKKYGTVYGHYEGSRPAISVADPKLLRDILVKDFPFFANRREIVSTETFVTSMLPTMTGEDWKRVRTIVTPTFTSGKLKRMIGIFKECSMTLVQNFKKAADKKTPINAKKLYGTMAMDVIASSAFSTKIDSHNNPENRFVQMSRRAFGPNVIWRFAFVLLAPKLMKFLRISVFAPDVMKFFRSVTLQIIEERKRLNQTRNDFLQLLIDTAKNAIKTEKWENTDSEDLANNYGEVADQRVFASSVTKSLSMDEMVGQCIIFFIAGYDTTASTLSFVSYCLALNRDVQEKARKEIRDCLEENKGELTYDVIQKMKYLDNVISETLRVYPPATRMERKTEADYKLGDTGIIIPKDMIITIPTYAMHKDPKYFPDPEKFDPDRFIPEERAKRDPFVYMPFGAGPRNCVGMRFALLEVKVCLIHVINFFDINTCKETKIPLKFYPSIGLLQPTDVTLKMEPRSDSIQIK